MSISKERLNTLINQAFPDATITLSDTTGTGDYFAVHVVSAQFAGKTRVQQHQMVYQAIGTALDGALHALSIKTSVPKDA